MTVDFIGLGAQKAGTSWVYACLYEHPEIHAPIKELHFFSRDRFGKEKEWYESHFAHAKEGQKIGEFSTSYLYSALTPERIKDLYPDAKLIAILRNPRARAYSQYRNAIKAGEIGKEMPYETFLKEDRSAIDQGQYAEQLKRYFALFPKEQILVLIYEDIKKDPAAFMRRIYEFIGVDPSFVPSMLGTRVNIARTPRMVGIDRLMHHVAEALRKTGFDKLVWRIRRSGLPDLLRRFNTSSETAVAEDEVIMANPTLWTDDAAKLSQLIGRDMTKEWNL